MRRRLLDHTYKKTVTGNPAVAKSVARRNPDISFPGKTEEQQQTNGYQLFDASKLPTKSQGGATVTNNGDGSFTISGEGNFTRAFNLTYSYSNEETKAMIKPGKLSLKISEVTMPTFAVLIRKKDSSVVKNLSTNASIDITETEFLAGEYLEFRFYGGTGKQITNATVSPMVYQEGNGTWEPYTGGKPSPSPEHPQDIVNTQSPVQVELTGANLCNPEEIVIGGLAGSSGAEFSTNNRVRSGYIPVTDGNYYIFGVPDNFVLNNSFSYNDRGERLRIIPLKNPITINQGEAYYRVSIKKIDDSDFTPDEIEVIKKTIFFSTNENIPYESYKQPQTVTITSDRPITKWDKLTKKGNVWGWMYQTAYIESYNGEEITEEWQSTTGELSTGASVQYKTSPEFVPLSDEEQRLMNALHTNNPTTVVQNSIGTDVTLTYKTKRSLEVTQ